MSFIWVRFLAALGRVSVAECSGEVRVAAATGRVAVRRGNLRLDGSVQPVMMKKTLVLASGLLVAFALILGACADPDSEQGAASGGSPTTVAPTTTPPEPPTSGQPGGKTQVQAKGTVQQGVEPGCLILDTGQGQRYVLLSKDKAKLKPGAKVEVTGVQAAGLISYCQEGLPLQVESVKLAS
jgi:hypothetical protein